MIFVSYAIWIYLTSVWEFCGRFVTIYKGAVTKWPPWVGKNCHQPCHHHLIHESVNEVASQENKDWLTQLKTSFWPLWILSILNSNLRFSWTPKQSENLSLHHYFDEEFIKKIRVSRSMAIVVGSSSPRYTAYRQPGEVSCGLDWSMPKKQWKKEDIPSEILVG